MILQELTALPNNTITISVIVTALASVVIFLFNRYDKGQERRIEEMKTNNDKQYTQLRKDFDEEKAARMQLQQQVNGSVNEMLHDIHIEHGIDRFFNASHHQRSHVIRTAIPEWRRDWVAAAAKMYSKPAVPVVVGG